MISRVRYLVIAALMLLAAMFMAAHHDHPTPLPRPLDDFPVTVGPWRLVRDSRFDQAVLDVLKPTSYLARRYANADGAVVELYVGYHDGAAQAGPVHSPKNCLPGSGWYEVASHPATIPLRGGKFDAVQAEYSKGATTEFFLYWFEVSGCGVTNEYAMKILELVQAVRHGRRDASFIRISTPEITSKEQAAMHLIAFAQAVSPLLQDYLPSPSQP